MLDFIPLPTGRYYLPCRGDTMNEPVQSKLIELRRCPELRKILSDVPGYGTAITGKFHT
jgi:hypothetical protein